MEKKNVIEINPDKACSKCGAIGALTNRLCKKCVDDGMIDKLSPIREKTINAIVDQVEGMLRAYIIQINSAYRNGENLRIGFAAEIAPGTGGDMVITTKISFVEARIKDELQITVNEAQEDLFH